MDRRRLAIRGFVQEVLGCGCPEEVFRHIETGEARWGGVGGLRIVVGGRLLVAVFDTDDAELVRGRLAGWVAEGMRERDRAGLNRLRIVVATSTLSQMEPIARRAFAESPGCDDRTHLHVVDRRCCEWQTEITRSGV